GAREHAALGHDLELELVALGDAARRLAGDAAGTEAAGDLRLDDLDLEDVAGLVVVEELSLDAEALGVRRARRRAGGGESGDREHHRGERPAKSHVGLLCSGARAQRWSRSIPARAAPCGRLTRADLADRRADWPVTSPPRRPATDTPRARSPRTPRR